MPPIAYEFVGPDGAKHRGKNLREFCRAHNIDNANTYQVLMGARRHSAGFTCPEAGYIRTYQRRV